jgi:hypothetical protein
MAVKKGRTRRVAAKVATPMNTAAGAAATTATAAFESGRST